MGLLTRDQILHADDIKTGDVEVPEWGGTVRIRPLTGAQRDAFESATIEQRGKNPTVNLKNLRARLVAASACDEKGRLLFTEEDVAALGRKSAKALNRVFEAAQKLSGLTDEDVAELAEDFADAPSESSTSD